jgi:ketosteroid isomerase-like protein
VSQENVEILRRSNDAYKRGDWEALAALHDPNVFVRTDPRWPEQFIFGSEAWVTLLREMRESVGPDVHVEELIDLGDRALARLTISARGQESGVTVEQSVSEIVTVREGRIIFVEYFLDHERALKAVGLEE